MCEMIAIIPAAGKGTRMLSVTQGQPKELLPLGHSTVLDRITDEARRAEIERIRIINSPTKTGIDEYAREKGYEIAIQVEAKGLGHALVQGFSEPEDCVVLLGDTVFRGGSPIASMMDVVKFGDHGAIAVELVSEVDMSLYGIVDVGDQLYANSILEKPKPADTKSRLAVAARYALSSEFMKFAVAYVANPDRENEKGEISLTNMINAAILEGMNFKIVPLQGTQQRVDCGSVEEYLAAAQLSWD